MMNEQQLQRIEKGFAAGTPLSIYNPHGDRALADIMIDLESRAIVPALLAEVRSLRAKLDAVPDYAQYRRECSDWDPEIFSFDEWYERNQAVRP
jgi:hypothetical protein